MEGRASGKWFEKLYNSTPVFKDPLRDLCRVPDDDIAVVELPRTFRTIRSSVPVCLT